MLHGHNEAPFPRWVLGVFRNGIDGTSRRDYTYVSDVPSQGAYEGGTEYGSDVTALWLRRQAYYSYLAGGHHTYGHEGFWRLGPSLKETLDSPGARQMGVLKKAFLGRKQWWRLTPDQELLVTGGQTEGEVLNLAARHAEGRWAIVYTASPSRFSIATHKLGPGLSCEAFWIDPRTGDCGETKRYTTFAEQAFATPQDWEDGLLVLEMPETK